MINLFTRLNRKAIFVGIFSFSLLALSSLSFTRKAIAQEVSLSIFPPLVEVTVQPGKSVLQAYQIANESDLDLYLKPRMVLFEPKGNKGEIKLLDPKYQPAVIKYFSLANSDLKFNQTFKLSANSQKQLVLKIDLPENAVEKDYYLTLLFEQSEEGQFINQLSGSKNLVKIGSNLLLAVSESLAPKTQGVVEQFKPQPKINDFFSSTRLAILIKNTGNSFLKSEGQIEIKNLLTKKTTVLKLRPDNILVDSSREIICFKEESGEEPATTFPCSFSSLIPGYFQASLSFSPETRIEPSAITVFFWLLPIKAVLIVIILLVIVWQIKKIRR